jgi:DNA-binding MarR family transcriptional regulator
MVSPLDKEVAYGIRDLVTKMARRLRKQVSNPEQMSVAELNVLYLMIPTEEMLPSELSAQLNISSQYMSQVLNHLEELGYISRKPSPKDKRKTFAVLTAKGKKKIHATRQEREEWLADQVSKQYSAKDKELIQKAIKLILILAES